jgi:hypothetical protein
MRIGALIASARPSGPTLNCDQAEVVGDVQSIILCVAGHDMKKILAHPRALFRRRRAGPKKALESLIVFLEPDSAPQQALRAA